MNHKADDKLGRRGQKTIAAKVEDMLNGELFGMLVHSSSLCWRAHVELNFQPRSCIGFFVLILNTPGRQS